MNITTLAAELGSDPSGYGYAGMTDAAAAAALNLVRDGSVGAVIRVRRTDISRAELLGLGVVQPGHVAEARALNG